MSFIVTIERRKNSRNLNKGSVAHFRCGDIIILSQAMSIEDCLVWSSHKEGGQKLSGYQGYKRIPVEPRCVEATVRASLDAHNFTRFLVPFPLSGDLMSGFLDSSVASVLRSSLFDSLTRKLCLLFHERWI